MRSGILLFFLACSFSLSAQTMVTLDSLDKIITQIVIDSNKIKVLLDMPPPPEHAGRPGRRKKMEVLRELDLPPMPEGSVRVPRHVFLKKEELEAVLSKMDKSLKVYEKQQDTLRANIIREQMAALYQSSGDNRFALETFLQVQHTAEMAGDVESAADARVSIGNVYLAQRQYEKALSFYHEALALYDGLLKQEGYQHVREKLPPLHLNLGKCYEKLGLSEEALQCFDKALALGKELKNPELSCDAYTNLGKFYQEKQEWKQALEFHEKALEEAVAADNVYGQAAEFNNIGHIFLGQKMLDKAEFYFSRALKTSGMVDAMDQAREAYLGLSKSYEKRGLFDQAWVYYQEYEKLRDSLEQEEKDKMMTVLEQRYDAQKEEAEINRLEKENAWNQLELTRQKNIRNISLAGSGLLMLLAFGVWQRGRYQRQKERTELEAQRIAHLEQLNRLKDEFLANTSHELRTPLNGIIGLAESLCDGAAGNLPGPAVSNLQMIASSGRRLSSLVNDILDFSRIRNNDLALQLRPVDLRAATEIVLTLSQPLVGGKPVELRNEIPNDLPLVEADENRVQQILHNLVGNAVKFTERGLVKISAEERDDCLAITITDTGVGIPTDKQEAIFRSFEQADGSVAREYGGTGLGLTVTKQLVELHGGSIEVVSDPGRGSRFTFTLPLCDAEEELVYGAAGPASDTEPRVQKLDNGHSFVGETAVAAAPVMTAVARPAEKVRILIVDDEPVNLQVLENHLSLRGYQVVKAGSGLQALEILQEDRQFDLIILDIMMPRMSGYEVCQKLRGIYPPSDLPIVMLTAKNRVADLVKGFDVGANDYLTKPFSKDELLSRIETHLRLNRIHKASGKFVPFEFLRSLGRATITEVELGDQAEKEVTVFFSDIRDYTSLSETMTPSENFQFVYGINERMGPIIRRNHGFINQYLGDAIMAIFPEEPDDALRAAIAMQQRLKEYNQERRQRGRLPIRIGMGMHTGPLIMGIIGDQYRMDAATIADAVNTASRIENLSKYYDSSILLSEYSLSKLHDPTAFHTRFMGKVQVKGRRVPVGIYECFDGDAPELRDKKLTTLERFQEGLDRYFARDFVQAATVFKQVLRENPADHVAQIFLEEAIRFEHMGVPEDWTGVVAMVTK